MPEHSRIWTHLKWCARHSNCTTFGIPLADCRSSRTRGIRSIPFYRWIEDCVCISADKQKHLRKSLSVWRGWRVSIPFQVFLNRVDHCLPPRIRGAIKCTSLNFQALLYGRASLRFMHTNQEHWENWRYDFQINVESFY